MPQADVAQRPGSGPGRRRRSPDDYQQLLAHWRIEDVAKLRIFRANRAHRPGEIEAFASSIGRTVERIQALLWCLPKKGCFASAALIDDGPLTFAERMALIWEAERGARSK